MTPRAYRKFRISREFEFINKKASVPFSFDQDGCFDEKTEGQKSRDTVPLIFAFLNRVLIFLENAGSWNVCSSGYAAPYFMHTVHCNATNNHAFLLHTLRKIWLQRKYSD
jgi:hypothetical protein